MTRARKLPQVESSGVWGSVSLCQPQKVRPPTLPSGLTAAIVAEWLERSLSAQNLTRDVRDEETVERVAAIFGHAARRK